MTRLIMYPFLKQTVSLIYTLQNEEPALFGTVELCGIVPESIAFPGKDVSNYRNRDCQINIRLHSLDSMPMSCDDTVFLQLPYEDTPANKEFVDEVLSWMRERKKAPYTSPTEALVACGYSFSKGKINTDFFQLTRPVLKPLNVPVIGICSAFPHLDTSEVTAKIKKYLSDEMTVSTVYTNNIHRGWGHRFVDLDYLKGLTFEDRIYYVNWYLDQILNEESSDILVVEIPNAVVGLNMRTLFGGGEYPFIFSEAVGLDYVICCVPANDITTFSFPHLKKHLETRYGMHNISFHVSNQHFFLGKESYNGSIPHMFVSPDFVAKEIAKTRVSGKNLPIYDFWRKEEFQRWRKRK